MIALGDFWGYAVLGLVVLLVVVSGIAEWKNNRDESEEE